MLFYRLLQQAVVTAPAPRRAMILDSRASLAASGDRVEQVHTPNHNM